MGFLTFFLTAIPCYRFYILINLHSVNRSLRLYSSLSIGPLNLSDIILRFHFPYRQSHYKGHTLATNIIFHPHCSTMQMDKQRDKIEAYSCADIAILMLGRIETLEDALLVLIFYADARV